MKKLLIASCGGFIMLATSSVITPICLPEISRTFSTSHAEGGGLETARTFFLLIVFIIAGAFAQRWGKKRFITMGHYFLAAGLLLISFSQSYSMLVFSLMVTGIGGGFIEALINPMIVDINSKKSGKYLNITNAFFSIGVLLSAFIFGELLTSGYSWRIIFRFASAGAFLMGNIFNILHFPIEEKNNTAAWQLYKRILVNSGFSIFAVAIFIAGGIESAFTFWSRSYVETYLTNSPRASAIAVVIFAATMAAGRLMAGKLSTKLNLKKIMIGSSLLGVIVSAILPFANDLIWFYFFLALAGIAAACLWPTILTEATSYLKVDSTLLIILLGFSGIVGYGITPWIMGRIGDSAGLKIGFYIIPCLFIGLIIVLLIESRMSHNKSK